MKVNHLEGLLVGLEFTSTELASPLPVVFTRVRLAEKLQSRRVCVKLLQIMSMVVGKRCWELEIDSVVFII